MENLFVVLFLLSFVGLIVGLVRPKLVIRWGSTRTRGRVILTYGLAMVIFLILLGATAPPATKQVKQKPDATPSPVVEQEKPKEFSKLEITDVVYEDDKIRVSGITDLPDGSQLSVDFDVAGRAGTATYIGVSVKVKVESSKFTATLTPPNRPEFARGPYVVEVMFTPRAQSDVVLKLVGKDGEHLEGDKVRESYGIKIMETSRQMDLQLRITSYPMVSASSYSADSPERAFVEFLISWREKDWSRMAQFTQKTWNSKEKNPAEFLDVWYELKDLLGAEIIKKSTVSDVTVDITATVYYAVGSKIETKKITARVIREVAAYTPSPKGEWGVNPISTLREE
ncbi:hypothetical protein ES702_00646 [subsurface metagenome]